MHGVLVLLVLAPACVTGGFFDKVKGAFAKTTQCCGVGKIFCENGPLEDVTVVLMDEDNWSRDDQVGRAVTNSEGFFRACGEESDAKWSDLKLYIKVETPCGTSNKCYRVDFSNEDNGKASADFGTLKLPDDERVAYVDC